MLKHSTNKTKIYNNEQQTMAGKPGFEPRLTDPESVVLPLNYFPSL